MADVIGSVALIKDASDEFQMGPTNVGSVYLKATRIEETFAKNSEIQPFPKFDQEHSQGPNSIIVDPLLVTRSWNITGILSGSPDAYRDIMRIGSMVRFGKLSKFLYKINGVNMNSNADDEVTFLVDINRFQPVRVGGEENKFDYTMLLIAGSIIA